MDPDARLFQGIIGQGGETVIQRVLLGLAQVQTELAAKKPFPKQFHFPVQQRGIVGGQ